MTAIDAPVDPLLPQQRRRQILALLQEGRAARVNDLARRLGVTSETVRRDLRRLDREGLLVRTHGGAVTRDDERRDLPLDVRERAQTGEKAAIAAVAATLVEEGDVVCLDASTTCLELARRLPDRPATVITPSLAVASALADRSRIEVVLTGGTLDPASMSLVGPMSLETLRRFNIGKLFFSCRGVDLGRGLSEASDRHAALKRQMLDLAERSYLLADASKLGLRSVVFFAQAADVDALITDAAADPATLDELRTAGVEVCVAP